MAENRHSVKAIWSLIVVESLSVLGAEIARFGVSVWVYKTTQSVTDFSVLVIAGSVPGIIVAPLVGSLIDRYARKWMIILASVLGLIGTLIVFAGAQAGELSLVAIVIGASLASIGETFQWTALASALPVMASDKDLPRFNGFVEVGRALSMFAGPMIGGLLYGILGLSGLLAVEVATFSIAVLVVASLTLPSHAQALLNEKPHLLSDSLVGLKWLWTNKKLLKFLGIAVFANFFISIGIVLMTPYGLSMLSETDFGIANGLFGGGMMCGGLVYGVIASRIKNIHVVLVSMVLVGVSFVAYGFSRSLLTIAGINFIFALLITLNNGATLTIWQQRIPEEVSGRVLAAVRMVAYSTLPVAYALAGPLDETLLPQVFALGGDAVHWIIITWGESLTGHMGFLFSVMGLLMATGFILASLSGDIRRVEEA